MTESRKRIHLLIDTELTAAEAELAASQARELSLRGRVVELTPALEFYADPAMYECGVKGVMHECANECWAGIDDDMGGKARAILAAAVAQVEQLRASALLLARHTRFNHDVGKHGLAWEECDAPMCEDARAAGEG